jgi:hypothetical protein
VFVLTVVALDVLLTFNRLRSLCADKAVIAAALESSATLKLSDDKSSVARREAWSAAAADADSTANTLYVENLPLEIEIETLSAAFSKFGSVKLVSIVRNKDKQCRGFAFIEFASAAEVEAAVKELPARDSKQFYESLTAPSFELANVRVMSKAEWQSRKEQQSEQADGKKRKLNNDSASTEQSIVLIPNALVQVTNIGITDETTSRSLRVDVSAIKPVKFVDWVSGDSAYVRFASAEEATAFLEHISTTETKLGDKVIKGRLLSTDEQTAYWEDVTAKTAGNGSSRGGRGGRGGRGRGHKRTRRE